MVEKAFVKLSYAVNSPLITQYIITSYTIYNTGYFTIFCKLFVSMEVKETGSLEPKRVQVNKRDSNTNDHVKTDIKLQ